MAAGSAILALLPESATSYTYGEKVVGTFNTDDETLTPVATCARPSEIATATGVTVCASKTSGNYWACYDADDDPYEGSYLLEIIAASGTVARKAKLVSLVPLPAGQQIPKLAERGGYHALFDLGCDLLLSVNRRTGQMIRVKLTKGASETDFWKAVVDYKYRLNVAPLDGALNVSSDRLIYCVNSGGVGKVNLWDLEKDVFVRTIVTVAA